MVSRALAEGRSDQLDAAAVLQLQRQAGNASVAELVGAPIVQRGRGPAAPPAPAKATPAAKPAPAVKKVAHTEGKKVDTYADASPFLKKYVEAKIKGGTKAEGHVHIYNAADFKVKCVDYLMAHQNPDTGKTFTKAEAEAWEPTINAYQDAGEIHIHEERGETATAIHESIHLYSNDSYLDKLGFNANEGTTEYWTRLLCTEQKIKRGPYYADQFRAVSRLIGAVGKKTVAAAYFNGDIDGLKKALDARAPKPKKGKIAKSLFDTWVGYMKQGRYTSANALF